ncbi:torsin-1A-interacting protein 2 isoform X2 [Trichomycterus rosablanca]|uniref:torsin-1A-interacting protein 2 isoform X2 n=1 Tax=Trichomycterus rosablanca TaxID=2290929 RepID=UPI002F35209D
MAAGRIMEVNGDNYGEDTNQPDVTLCPPLKKNNGKDKINMDAEKLPGSSPKARKGTKAHLGEGEDHIYKQIEKSQESGDKMENIMNSNEDKEAEKKDSISKSESPASGDKRQKCCDPGSETEKVSSQKTEEGPVSGTYQDLIIGIHYIVPAIFAIIIALVCYYVCTKSPSLQKDYNLLQVFSHKMEKVQSSFPSQRHELWKRTNIHLKRHLNLTNPLEPVSLILTSGQGAEKTLGCLAQNLATVFSAALNSSVLGIDGNSKTAQDSDQVKLSVDDELKKAFEGEVRAAVINHFEEFPPGSTLIFYRYCDHENAAYKKVFLVFTVMLPVTEVNSELSLREVEEQVQEYLKERFVSSARTATFNDMDVDKLSGLWSRISHLILPVAAEQNIEQKGCMNLK